MISGFVQLPQGLPSYHWMAIIDLAWFSSLTHLACLTILRGYLHHHSVERMLRVIAMACLATLLVIALSFTSSYSWANVAVLQGVTLSYEEATPTHAAICHMGVADFQMHLFGYLPMIFSIIMIVFGFLSRLIKLYKTVSVGFLHKTRVWLGIRARHLLCIVFNWCCTGAGQGLKRRLLYRPLLTVYLAARLLVDAWLSMLLEVAWLLAGFVWGSLRLMSLLLVVRQVMVDSSMIADTDNENKSWGFGQVVSIALLLAPFITFAGFFNDESPNLGRKAENSHDNSFPLEDQSSDLMEVPLMSPCNANTKDPEDPENDWNDHWELLGAAVTYLTTMSLALAVCTFAFSSSDTIVVGLIGVRIPLVIALLSFFELMLFSLTIEVDFTGLSSRGRKALHLVNIFLFAASPFPIFVLQVTNPSYIPSESGYSWFGNYWFMILAACFYVLYTIPRSLSDHAHIGHSLRPRV
ncbi:hypothetical protein N7456_004563 [Penicillium angulare]|uniref:Transmembrane protein n=1 Tax=Penicillium angulare TaxID=116970 RepID=A0A9W9FWS9_9EURO|nr:hypothetical protein N7456_004563 [Penicillium angulare]